MRYIIKNLVYVVLIVHTAGLYSSYTELAGLRAQPGYSQHRVDPTININGQPVSVAQLMAAGLEQSLTPMLAQQRREIAALEAELELARQRARCQCRATSCCGDRVRAYICSGTYPAYAFLGLTGVGLMASFGKMGQWYRDTNSCQ